MNENMKGFLRLLIAHGCRMDKSTCVIIGDRGF